MNNVITIIDYGMGNIGSIYNIIKKLEQIVLYQAIRIILKNQKK